LTPLSDLQAEDEEKTIGMQTTHLPKIPVIAYPLHSQLSLARRSTQPLTQHGQLDINGDERQPERSGDGEGKEDGSGVIVKGAVIEEARGKSEAEERKRNAEEEAKRRRDEAAREAEERLFRDYCARVLADGAADGGVNGDATAQQQQRKRPSFTLDFTLRFKTEAEQLRDVSANQATDASSSAMMGKSLPGKLYTLVLSFAPSRLYEPLESVHIPYLCLGDDAATSPSSSTSSSGFAVPRRRSRRGSDNKNRSGEGEDVGEATTTTTARFPYVYDVMIEFRPLVPLPASFAVSATFNDREGHICEGQMEPLHVHFTDLFLPLPLSSSSSSLPSSPRASEVSRADVEGAPAPLSGDALLRAMWRQLWRRVNLPGMGIVSAASGAGDSLDEGYAHAGHVAHAACDTD
jgi:hypothetical protein